MFYFTCHVSENQLHLKTPRRLSGNYHHKVDWGGGGGVGKVAKLQSLRSEIKHFSSVAYYCSSPVKLGQKLCPLHVHVQ